MSSILRLSSKDQPQFSSINVHFSESIWKKAFFYFLARSKKPRLLVLRLEMVSVDEHSAFMGL